MKREPVFFFPFREGMCKTRVYPPQIYSWGMYSAAVNCRNRALDGTFFCAEHPDGYAATYYLQYEDPFSDLRCLAHRFWKFLGRRLGFGQST